MDKLKDIETFVSVVEKGSFLGAAAVLSVTPVMIGRRISQLEKRLGGELFHRTTRGLTLTRQG
jgi:DNA-binding transcriptional LysR family regulator